jgi:tetratricopeptide (TPR) repeat protein
VEVRGIEEYARLAVSLWPRVVELLFLPSRMAIDHEIFLPASWAEPAVLGGLALWAGAVAVLVLWLRRPSFWQLPVLWVFITLIPTNSILPVLDPLAERHLYIAIPALAWGAGLLLVSSRRAWLAPVLAGLVVYLTAEARQRVPHWRSTSALWSDAYEKYPGKFRVVFNTATYLVQNDGDFRQAAEIFFRFFAGIRPGHLPYQQQEIAARFVANSLRYLGEGQEMAIVGAFQELGGKGHFFSEYSLLRALKGIEPEARWLERWQGVRDAFRHSPRSERSEDPAAVAHTLDILLAEQLREAGRLSEATEALERVLFQFRGTHIPYWNAREALGDLYRAQGEREKALEQFDLAATQYKVFKQFPLELHKKIYALRLEQDDYHRASDAMGELVRVYSDDPQIRALYAESLGRMGHRHAARQLREAEFYSRFYISPQDEREFIRP